MAFLFKARTKSKTAEKTVRTAPFILDRNLRYLDEPNRFLREIASGRWRGGQSSSDYGSAKYRPSDNTMRAKSNALENFWSYIESMRIDWRALSYDNLLATYDADMASGAWSFDGKTPLAASTINLRVGIVCEFMQWSTARGYRAPFQVAVKRIGEQTYGWRTDHRARADVTVRLGRHRVDPRRLRLPMMDEINAWLHEIECRRGLTKALACRTILNTGMRLEECVSLRTAQVKDALNDMESRSGRTDDESRWVGLEICFGTKGGRRPNDPDLRGRPRILRVRPQFLESLDRYLTKARPFALRRFRTANPRRSAPPEIFLSERTGEPITKGALYKAWHECRALPFAGWSPHMGRHAWACFTLLSHVQRERHLLATIAGAGAAPMSWAMQIAVDFINVVLRPAMGHVSERTTEGYLSWLDSHLLSSDLRSAWAEFLEDGRE